MSFIPDPGTSFTQGQEPEIVARLRRLAAYLKTNIYGISGYRSPARSVAVGGFADDPHTRGQAADIGVGSPSRASAGRVSESVLERFGLTRPFGGSAEINHIQLLPGASSSPSNTISQLWIREGGSPGVANIMAAIAMAESGGRVDAESPPNTDGTVDIGLFQINSSHTQFDQQRLKSDAAYNTRAAISIYKSQGLSAWTTFTSGAYRQFLGQGSTASVNYGGPNGGMVRPGGDKSGPAVDLGADFVSLDTARQAPQQVGFDPFAPFKWWWGNFSSSWDNFYHDLTGPADTLVKTGEETAKFAEEGVKILENLPWYTLRAVEFLTGMILMYLGMRSAVTSRQPTLASTGTGIARVTRELTAATPVGRARRISRGTRAGRYEGETEHARLTARREARQREAQREQTRGQRRRELRNGQ